MPMLMMRRRCYLVHVTTLFRRTAMFRLGLVCELAEMWGETGYWNTGMEGTQSKLHLTPKQQRQFPPHNVNNNSAQMKLPSPSTLLTLVLTLTVAQARNVTRNLADHHTNPHTRLSPADCWRDDVMCVSKQFFFLESRPKICASAF